MIMNLLSIFNNTKSFEMGGVHPAENKLTADEPIQVLPPPDAAVIHVAQHIGAPATITVTEGQKVRVGDVIANHTGYVSSNIHSSVSGTVENIENLLDTSGFKKTAISIRVEGDEWLPEIDRTPDLISEIKLSSEEIIERIHASGVVGLGGAAFPSHVKLNVPKDKVIDHLLLNGVECEPYLTADHRLMLEKPEELIIGIRVLMKALNVDKAIIGIENNKRDAIQLLTELTEDEEGIGVQALEVKYPQGGEKQLIKAVLGREVPSGGLPADVGVLVQNVGTTLAVYEAVQKNKPLVDRITTLTGVDVAKPGNYLVRIGTPIRDLINASGGVPEHTGKIVSGGPMMGKALPDLLVPIAKATSGILLIPESESRRAEEYNCVRCGKCVEVCPMGLEPYLLMTLSQGHNHDKSEKENVLDCIECGSCAFTCPSNRPLLDWIRLSKNNIRKAKTAKA
jgi:electron transport complex protein RnfC